MKVEHHRDGRTFTRFPGPNGKRMYKFFGKGPEADKRCKEFIAQHHRPGSTSGAPTLADLTLAYLQIRQPHQSTAQSIRKHVFEYGAEFARKPADELTRFDLAALREVMSNAEFKGRRLKPRTINQAQSNIRAILQWGVEEGYISVNPWAGFKKLKVGSTPPPTLPPDALDRLLAVAPPWLQWAMLVAYNLYLRPGKVELFSLKWTAFDWAASRVTVIQAKTRRPKVVYPDTEFMRLAFQVYQANQAKGFTLVCHRGDGKRVRDYRNIWEATVDRAGFKKGSVRFYDLRHHAISGSLAAGADLAAVSAQAGHATPYVTASVYSHALPGAQQRAAEKLPKVNLQSDICTTLMVHDKPKRITNKEC